MPGGFLSLYRGTEKVFIDGGEDWWVEVRQVLLKREMAQAQALLTRQGGQVTDIGPYQTELVALSITGWNLTDDEDRPLPHAPLEVLREVLEELPQPVFLQLYQRCADLNSPRSKEEERSFRNGAARGHLPGADHKPDPRPGLDQAQPVGSVRADVGDAR
jgi:hypothetical protein